MNMADTKWLLKLFIGLSLFNFAGLMFEYESKGNEPYTFKQEINSRVKRLEEASSDYVLKSDLKDWALKSDIPNVPHIMPSCIIENKT